MEDEEKGEEGEEGVGVGRRKDRRICVYVGKRRGKEKEGVIEWLDRENMNKWQWTLSEYHEESF